MAKLNQGTTDRCCLTCGGFQSPDGSESGLCFDPRHKCKRAKVVRDSNVCCYWHPLATRHDRPVALFDRIVAVLAFSNGNAPRGCREICDLIDREFGGHAFAPDVARLLEHSNRTGRIVQVPDKGKNLVDYENWVTAYGAILGNRTDRVVQFHLPQSTREAFELRFGDYCHQRTRGGAA